MITAAHVEEVNIKNISVYAAVDGYRYAADDFLRCLRSVAVDLLLFAGFFRASAFFRLCCSTATISIIFEAGRWAAGEIDFDRFCALSSIISITAVWY